MRKTVLIVFMVFTYTIHAQEKMSIQGNDTASSPGFVYLSDLDWSNNQGSYLGNREKKEGPFRDISFKGTPLKLNGVQYAKGLGCNPTWNVAHTVTYPLGGQYERFTCIVGIDDYAGDGINEEAPYKDGFEWVVVRDDGTVMKKVPYRGQASRIKKDALLEKDTSNFDLIVPYWPGSQDVGNRWHQYYEDEVPGKHLVMTRPACMAKIFVDGVEVWSSGNMTRPTAIGRTPVLTVDISVSHANELTLWMHPDGVQTEPITLLVKGCPWRDFIDWADAKLYKRDK